MIRSSKDFYAGLLYIFFGASAFVIARDYNMGTAFRMGPAYFPTVLSVVLIVIGVTSVFRAFIIPGTSVGRLALSGLLWVTASVVLFGFLVRGAGLAVALPLLVVSSASASAKFRWRPTLVMAVGITVFCVLVFLKGLGIPLPVMGFWLGG
ncbi:MAG TPA: tripartite tricarboxylate transporter TctB family protein [Candidatus Limnocylindrales bacterium]|nr:tripartite tricarboxylate transporter TctB family protein [Candidatus Limnocylindrales bacterium]